MKLGRGAVIVVELDPTLGHEQHGVRPCIVVSDPDVISDQRFPLVCVVPVTATPGEGLLYPPLAPGKSGLAKKSFALIDHLRSIDKRRVRRVFGGIAPEEMAAIDEGLAVFLGFGDRLHVPGAPRFSEEVCRKNGFAGQRPASVRCLKRPNNQKSKPFNTFA